MIDAGRRTVLGLMGAALAAPAFANVSVGGGEEVLPLWPAGRMPGGPVPAGLTEKAPDQNSAFHPDRWITGVSEPRLIVHRPARANGSAVMLMPGGGYGFLSYDNEGIEQARWLNAQGITAFILLYRLPDEGWRDRAIVPLQDAQRGLRLIRANARRYAIHPERVSILGFSAGGHLAGSLATRHAEHVYDPIDQADTLSARPDLAGLIYPVVSMSEGFTHGGSRDNLLGKDASEAEKRHASVDLNVDAQTSPCFMAAAGDDGLVPVANSIQLYTALQAQKRPAELHIFNEGGHGFGVRLAQDKPGSAWPRLFTAFAQSIGAFPRA